jgi:hypothetical protein
MNSSFAPMSARVMVERSPGAGARGGDESGASLRVRRDRRGEYVHIALDSSMVESIRPMRIDAGLPLSVIVVRRHDGWRFAYILGREGPRENGSLFVAAIPGRFRPARIAAAIHRHAHRAIPLVQPRARQAAGRPRFSGRSADPAGAPAG